MKFPWLIIIFLPMALHSQNSISEKAVERAIDLYLKNAPDEIDNNSIENLRWQLEEVLAKPIDINHCEKSDLAVFPFLDYQMLHNIFEYRENYAPILAIEELQQINSLNHEIISTLKPFLSFSSDATKRNQVERKWNHQFLLRSKFLLDKPKGFNVENGYLGDPYSTYFRLMSKAGKRVQFSISGENDIGESFFSPRKGLMDHQSFYVKYESSKRLRKLLLGDYQLSFGQGLVMNSSLGLRKSAQVLSIQQYRNGLFAHNSGSELFYLRGIASEIQLKSLHLAVFSSYKKVDAGLNDSGQITSLTESGLHRTNSERSKKGNTIHALAGLNADYLLKGWILGITFVSNQFNRNFRADTSIENPNPFTQSSSNNLGLHAECSYSNANFFGETAFDDNLNNSFILGTTFMPASNVSLAIHLRNIDKDYRSQHLNTLSDRSNPRAESGIYTGIKIKFSNRLKSSFYLDEYKHNCLNTSNSGLTDGRDFLINMIYSTYHSGEFSLRFRQSNDLEFDEFQGINIDQSRVVQKRQIRIQYQWFSHSFIRWKVRYEKVFVEDSEGQLCFLELKFKKQKSKFSFVSRYSLFDTDDFNSRIYTFDHDVSGLFLNTAHFESGSHIYFLLKYKIGYFSELQFKYSQTSKMHKFSMGSGLSEIKGGVRRTINVALTFKY